MFNRLFYLIIYLLIACTNLFPQWYPLNGKKINDATSFIIDNSSIIITTHHGIYRSTDSGYTWLEINTGLNNLNINSLCMQDSVLYIGSYGSGVFCSSDRGNNWIECNNGLEHLTIISLYSTSDYIFASTENGLFRYSKNNKIWNPINNGLTELRQSCLIKVEDYLFAGTWYGGIFKSSDNGDSWTRILNYDLSSVRHLTFINNTLFASTYDNLFYSTDYGNTWQNCFLGNYSSHLWVYTANNDDNFIYASTEIGLFRSPINSISFSKVSDQSFDQFIYKNNKLFGINSAGLFYSINSGIDWSTLNTYIPSDKVFSTIKSGDNLFVGSGAGLFFSSDNGVHWYKRNEGIVGDIRAFLSLDNLIFAASYGFWNYRTSDNGITWIKLQNGITNNTTTCFARLNNDILIGTYGGSLFKSSNLGEDWTQFYEGGWPIRFVTCLLTLGDNIFVGTEDQVLYRSPNAGNTWTLSGNGISGSGRECIRDLVSNNNNVYVATDAGVFISSNYGYSWSSINQGFEGILIKSLASYQDKLFASGWYNGDVFISLNGGLNWKSIKIGMPSDAEIFSIDAFDNRLFASTLNHGLYCIDISEIIVDVNDENSPNLNFSLEQNYPNPFNSSTNINFNINNEGLVTLKIYNCLGEEIYCLINDILQPGQYSKQFSTNNLSSGIYFYTLNYQNKIVTKKMCLLK